MDTFQTAASTTEETEVNTEVSPRFLEKRLTSQKLLWALVLGAGKPEL